MRHKRSRGVLIFGLLLILSSLVHVHTLITRYDWYRNNFRYMPQALITLRYMFSWLQRIVGLSCGVGILRLKDFFRKVAIGLCAFTIATIYWKHPYQAFYHHAQSLDQQMGTFFASHGVPEMTFASLTRAAVITHCVLDIIFCASLIYFFTRPGVKAQFKG